MFAVPMVMLADDLDFDDDGIENRFDLDDDNDGIKDAEESPGGFLTREER
jgi:hypothetical protein